MRRSSENGKAPRAVVSLGLAEVATELGLSPGQLSAWRTEHLAAGSD